MIEQLSQLSKTIPLTNSHTAQEFNTLTKNCPKELIILADNDTYFFKAMLGPKSDMNILEGIFHCFQIKIEERVTGQANSQVQHTHGSGIHTASKQSNQKYQFQTQSPITANNFTKYITTNKSKQPQPQNKTAKYNEFVDFDRKILKLFMAMRYEQNYSIQIHEKLLTVDCQNQVWNIPLVCYQDQPVSQVLYKGMKFTIGFINTLDYLTRVEANLQIPEPKSTSPQPNPTTQSQQQINQLILQNTQLKQKLHTLQTQQTKSTQKIHQLQQQLKSIQKQLYNHSEMIEVQENKMMSILDQLQEIKKQKNQGKIMNLSDSQIKSLNKNRKGVVTVPDYVREKLAIDLHSSYLGKFQITGNQITYIGQNQQATQLLSSRIFTHKSTHTHLKSTLHIIKTQAKCIKFGIIDTKYSTQRSCWNYPNIIYLHGWGHTMVSRHEQNHKNCDYGTGSVVEMEVDFVGGWIKWIVDGKREVVLREYQKMIRSDVEWAPFIAMHNYMDCVQWSIGGI